MAVHSITSGDVCCLSRVCVYKNMSVHRGCWQLMYVTHRADLWPSHWLFPSSYYLLSQTQSASGGPSPTAAQGRPMSWALPALCANCTCFECVLSHTHILWAWEQTLSPDCPAEMEKLTGLCLPISCQAEPRTCPLLSQLMSPAVPEAPLQQVTALGWQCLCCSFLLASYIHAFLFPALIKCKKST